jgi:L,D-peptidoglycan transpeptidase YkuD (ErfK/YbiS/YcfS/YnhG family)
VGPRRRTLATIAVFGLLASACTSSPHSAPLRGFGRPHSPAAGTQSERPGPTATALSPAPKPKPKPATSTSHAASTPPEGGLPLAFRTGDARQVITAVAPSTSSTEGSVQAWRKVAGGWRTVGPPVHAWFGTDGLTRQPSESLSATPIGSFTLTRAFGRLGDPGTALPYTRTTPADWWISQSGPLYNTRQRCSSQCAFTRGDPNEHLYDTVPYYRYAVVIDYNTRNSPTGVVQGAGSAFFLHVTVGAPTQGCISIAQAQLVRLLRWLSPARHPRILIGT